MKTIFLAVILSLFTLDAQAFLWFKNKEKKETTSENVNATAQNAQGLKYASEGIGAPSMTYNVSGSNNAVDVNVVPSDAYKREMEMKHQGEVGFKREAEETSFSQSKMPLLVGIFLACLGLGFALLCWVLWSKLSATGKASDIALANVVKTADTGFGVVAGLLESRMATATSPEENALISSVLNSVNKERGKLRK